MPKMYFGWGLLGPVCLCLVYEIYARRAMRALGFPQGKISPGGCVALLLHLALYTFWGMVNIPLPVVYVFAFLEKLPRLLRKRASRLKELFLINFTHLTIMALHMILIGVISLVTKIPMRALLQQPFWRIVMIDAILAVSIVTDGLIPRWNMALDVLRTQSESAEVRPFMLFLWFCNIFLLLDSVLCVLPIDWRLLPLFLIGSTVLLEFYLVRFLKHLYTILKERYLEEEHRRLSAELDRQSRDAALLRSKSMRDAMTGAYSRQYVLERTAQLLQAGAAFSFVFIDLDHLKQINDRQGHSAGDRYLMDFAQKCNTLLRQTDVLARVGGDEFVVLMPGCAQEKATARMEEIRSRLTVDCSAPFHFSYGVAYAAGDAQEGVEQIFRRADQAMYQDKYKSRG
nr:GGDEF domain-containing protein [Maliibacterium massiliense]